MIKVNLFDGTFGHSLNENGFLTSTKDRKPTLISYKEKLMSYDGITVFSDEYMYSDFPEQVKTKTKVGWCIESPGVKPQVTQNLEKIDNRFDYIITFRRDLIEKNPKKYLPAIVGGTWINENDHGLYKDEKSKNCSIILSGKSFLPGQQLRHAIYRQVQGIDAFGGGTKTGHIFDKLDSLKNYKFTFVIENCQYYNYFTEKLIDAFVTGCIPIYWGCPNIGDFFDLKGLILFNSLTDIKKLKLSNNYFIERSVNIKNNFKKAQEYLSSDDSLAKTIKKYIL
jgi:hypothetical protein